MLELKDIELSYGKIPALKHLSLEVMEKEIYALVGPESSGKSSVCKVAAGLLAPDRGDVLWYDKKISKVRSYKWNVGYVPEKWRGYQYQTVLEYMVFFGSLYGMSQTEAVKQGNELLRFVGLEQCGKVYMTELTKGEKCKLLVARAMMNKPQLLVLDNIFNGLDPVSRVELQALVQEIRERETAVLFTAGDIELASRICDKVAIIDQGKIAASGTVDDILRLKQSSNPIVIQVVDAVDKAVQILRNNPKVKSISRKDHLISVLFDGEDKEQASLLTELVMEGITIGSFFKKESDFDSLYLRITKRS